MGMESQLEGDKEGEGDSEMGREFKESRREHQEFSQPSKVTLEARNMAEQFMAKMDLIERMP